MATSSRIAKTLGVTPDGLEVLAMAVAHGGELYRTRGMASVKLEKQGYVIRHPGVDMGRVDGRPNRYGHHIITDAGRDIVRRARELGW